MSNNSFGSSNGNNICNDEEDLQNLRAIRIELHRKMDDKLRLENKKEQNELKELIANLGADDLSFISDEDTDSCKSRTSDEERDSYEACNGDNIESTEQQLLANSDGIFNNHHDMQNSQDQIAISELYSNTQMIMRSQQFLCTSEESLLNFPSHVNVEHQGHESASFYSDQSEHRCHNRLFSDCDDSVNYPSHVGFHGLHQEHGHYYRHHGQIDNSDNNHQDPQLCDVTEGSYGQPVHEHSFNHDQVQHHKVCDPHFFEGHDPGGHHNSRIIYDDRPYNTIQERKDAEGSNILSINDRHYYQHHYCINDAPGYTVDGPQMTEMEVDKTSELLNSKDRASCSSSQTGAKIFDKSAVASGGVGRKPPQVTYRFQNSEAHLTQPSESKMNSEITTASTEDLYKYSSRSKVEKVFMEQEGQGESQQLAQLQIMYEARGEKIEDLTSQMDLLKNNSAKEIKIMKQQLSMTKGEKEDAAKSLENVQSLLQESKSENAKLLGHVQACESLAEGLKNAKEELLKKLQTAESMIEAQQQHLNELGCSETFTRARQNHENVVNGLQKKYDAEIKHLKETIDCLNAIVHEKDEDITGLKQQLESLKNFGSAQVSREDIVNSLAQSLDESQKQYKYLLESDTTQQVSEMKIQLQQALAAKSDSDKLCYDLQVALRDLNEHVKMLKGASNLGVFLAPGYSSGGAAFTDQNDSMAELGIKKTLDFADTPNGTPIITKTQNTMKSELDGCLVSNKLEIKELNEQLQKTTKELMDYKQRCKELELLVQEQNKKIAEFEFSFSPSNQTSAIENRYKKEIEDLKRKKKALHGDVEELQKRLDESQNNMVKVYNQDKRKTVESVHQACEQDVKAKQQKPHQEMISHFDAERTEIIAKYEEKCGNLSDQLKFLHNECNKVKNGYMEICNEMKQTKENVRATMKKENEISLLSAEHEWSIHEEKSKIEEVINKESAEQLNIAQNNIASEHELKLINAQDKFENELKSLKCNLEMEKSNDVETLDKVNVLEIEKLKRILMDKESVFSEREQIFKEKEKIFSARNKLIEDKDRLLNVKDKCMEELKNKHKAVIDKLEIELSEKTSQIGHLTKELEESGSLNNYLKNAITSLEHLKNENVQETESLKIEKDVHGMVVNDMTTEINKLKEELEKIQKEKEAEIKMFGREDVDNVRKEIDKNIQKDRLEEIESLKKEVINLRLEMERIDSEKLLEIDKVYTIKQAEIENLEKRHMTEIKSLQKKYIEIEKVMREKNEEINKLQKLKEVKILDEDDVTAKIREELNNELEVEFNNRIETRLKLEERCT